MASCPHCSESIEKLSGFISQADHESRLKAKSDANTLLTSSLATANTKASAFDAIRLERDGLQAKLTGIEQQGARVDALKTAGLDVSLLDSVNILYKAATDGVEDAPTLGDWLEGDGKAHPLLADRFGTATPKADTNTGRPDLNGTPGPNLNPAAGKNEEPARPGGKMQPADVSAYFNSQEFSALSSEDRTAKVAELKAQVMAQDSAQA